MHQVAVRSQSPMCLPVAMGNPLATHTEASTKLISEMITAHQAHHCDDHPRSQSRDYFDSRSTVARAVSAGRAARRPARHIAYRVYPIAYDNAKKIAKHNLTRSSLTYEYLLSPTQPSLFSVASHDVHS